MPIDYRRLVDGLSEAAVMLSAGAAGLAAIDVVVTAAREATGAVGATFMRSGGDEARVVVASGEMSWAMGQPIGGGFLDPGQLELPWRGSVDRLAPVVAERLLGRGVLAMAGHPVQTPYRSIGAVHLYFGEVETDVWAQLMGVLRVVATAVAQIHGFSQPPVTAAVEEDDRTLFLAVAGHELRTPVTVVKGYASMLADRWESLDEDDRRDAARVLTSRADELARLVDRMLGASVGDGTSGWLVRSVPFDPVEALRRAVGELPAELRRDLRLEVPTSLPLASGDPTVLTPIVAELVNNAIRYTAQLPGAAGAEPQPGVEIKPGVEIQAGADAQTVFFRVCDRGIGIDATDVERAFERFWRARRDTDGRGGVGLGLYLVRRLVERQNGWVSLRPREGGGTVAEVRLQRADGRLRPSRPGEA
jgi:two-component system, OmpR family, phosphate regulon sensor histidine kinase PhoR